MISIFNKALLDTRKFTDWKAVVDSNFCSTGTAYHYQAVMADGHHPNHLGVKGGDGIYEDQFYVIKEEKLMRNLKLLDRPHHIDLCAPFLGENAFTIFEKIEFSDITKDHIKEKLHDLRTRQVPNRDVLLTMNDEDLTFYWFQNWLHPKLKHFFHRAPVDKRGCSKAQLVKDSELDSLHFYENGQQSFPKYTLADIESYIA